MQTTTVAKEKVYNGCRIGPEEGFVAERSDEKAKTIMNATEGISIYSDAGNGLQRNFFVDLDGRIKAKSIDIDGSGTFGGALSAASGTFTGQLLAASGTFTGDLVGGRILSNSTIDVETDAHIGSNLYFGLGFSASSGLYFGSSYASSYGLIQSDPVSGHLIIGFPNITGGAYIILTPTGFIGLHGTVEEI